jgi:Acetyltransferase (GNAT) domain
VSQVSKGMTVQIDVPAVNPQALSLVRERGLAPVFETARMVAGVAPTLPLSRRFGVTSFESG